MTPKEKAQELQQTMFGFIPIEKSVDESIISAKYCAKIAVIEMLKVISSGSYNETFYKEVLIEIDKL